MIKTGKYVCFENKVDFMKQISIDRYGLSLFGVRFYEEQKPKHYPAFFFLDDEYIDNIKWVQGNYQQPIIDYLENKLEKINKQIVLFKEDMNG